MDEQTTEITSTQTEYRNQEEEIRMISVLLEV